MRRVSCLFLAGISILSVIACTAAREEPATPKTTKPEPAAASRATWETKWNDVLVEAKKEGQVLIYNAWGTLVRSALIESFTKKYGIEVEWVPFGRGAEMLARINMEKVAGLKIADVYGAGGTTLVGTIKPVGLLGRIEPYLVLPEVLNPDRYYGNQMPFIDKDKTAIAMSLRITNNIVVNKELVNPKEFSSVKDLLKPQYKDKVTVNDPSVSGAGNGPLAALALHEWNEAETMKFLKDLMANGAIVTRDNRQQVEWMARGKYPIAVWPHADSLAEFLEAGAPLTAVLTREGLLVNPGSGAVSLPLEPAHPNATMVFLNWLLSKAGQTAFMKGTRQPIMRTDVPLEGIHAMFLPPQGHQFYFQTEDFIIYQANLMKATADVIAGR